VRGERWGKGRSMNAADSFLCGGYVCMLSREGKKNAHGKEKKTHAHLRVSRRKIMKSHPVVRKGVVPRYLRDDVLDGEKEMLKKGVLLPAE